MKPPLPPNLHSEEKSLWAGWNMIGDREVVREAAVKGTVALALKFLATRKELDDADVERWLKAEILVWVHQLLVRKQVFKASHILNNVGFDSAEQLAITFCETTDKEMRNYIAEHLLKMNKLDDALFKSWKFIKLLEVSNSSLLNCCENINKLSILRFDQLSTKWKSEIATEIFFDTYDFCLESYLTPVSSWEYLFKKEDYEIIKIWIRIYFSQDINYDCKSPLESEILNKLKNLFLFWPITNVMINDVENSSISNFFKNFVLNELSFFGIFSNSEKNCIKTIISRFVQTGNIQNIYRLLEEPTSCIRLTDYFEKLALFCTENNLFEVLSICTKGYHYPDTSIQRIDSKQFNLYISINDTIENLNNEKMFRKNILHVTNYFADAGIDLYLRNNPFILLALIFYNRDISMSDLLLNKTSLMIGDITFNVDMIIDYLKDLPVLQNILSNFSSNASGSILTLESLIAKNNDLGSILDYKANNKTKESFYIRSTSCDFTGDINYIYYIKRNRPSKAVKVFLLNQFKSYGYVSDLDKYDKSRVVEKIALKNCLNSEILTSCIAFLEMIGCPSNSIRVLIDIINNLQNLYKNTTDIPKIAAENPKELVEIMENQLLQKCCSDVFSDERLIEILRQHKLPVKFARVNNLELPEKFLNYCAEHNYWLPFLIFAQVNNYPVEITLKLVHNFENENIVEHLYHALSKDIQNYDEFEEKNSSGNDLIHSFTSQHSVNSNISELNFDFLKSNLLTILIKCHKSEDPPTSLLLACQNYKYPLLAVLATCYEPDSVIINWLTWLSISCNIYLETVENYAVTANMVTTLLVNVVKKRFVKTALESFQIFMSNHPFCLLLEFLNCCVDFDFNSSIQYLESFEKIISHLKYNHIIEENDFEYMFLNNGFWIVDTATKIIFATLGNCFDSRHQQIIFLDKLCSSNLSNSIPKECPNFCKICNLLQSLSFSNINIDLSLFWNPSERKGEIVRCIEILVDNKSFEYALELAKFEKILKEYVLNEEWSHKFKNRSDTFWLDCDAAFRNSKILPSSASEFFVNCCKELTNCSDKYKALKCAYTWLKKSDYSDPYIENIEQEIWSNYFALDDETLKGSHYDKNETNYMLSFLQENSTSKSQFNHTLSKEQLRHFDETVGKILESGDIIEALRLIKMFNHKNIEISILLTCYELAEGKLSPYQLSTEQRLLYENRDMNLKSISHRRRTHKSTIISNRSTGSFSSVNTEIVEIIKPRSGQDTLNLLETMTDRLLHGSNIAGRILMCYRISFNLERPYKSIVECKDSKILLKTVLDNNCKNKLEVVSDVLIIFKWTKKDIVNFISDEITKAIYKSLHQNLDRIIMWDLILDSNFHLILKLCPDFSSKLGEKLLKCANYIHRSHSQSELEGKDDDIFVVIELLIKAHDCFTAECNMEGISAILRKAQTLTSTLLNFKSWKLMVRLLTGIGRYTEMNYIFQILKENDQFEYLLRKGLIIDGYKLKVALLKYLKTHCPQNKKLFQMVALRFKLYSEVAELFENEAKEIIETLIETSRIEMQNQGLSRIQQFVLLTRNESTNVCLKKAMDNFTHAAEYHLLGDKLTKAMNAANQAEMIALQIALLKNVSTNATMNCILKIEKAQIQYLTTNELSFPHAKILIDSYNFQPDWGAVLFQRCIVKSDLNYLNEFLKAYPFTNTLAQDLTRRFLSENVNSVSSMKAMKEIISKSNSVQMQYRLASELGFTDVIESLLNNSTTLAYLKDTVWKKGFKQI